MKNKKTVKFSFGKVLKNVDTDFQSVFFNTSNTPCGKFHYVCFYSILSSNVCFTRYYVSRSLVGLYDVKYKNCKFEDAI